MTSKKSTKKKTTKTKVVSVGLQRDKNLEVAKIIVSIDGYQREPINWQGVNNSYTFVYDSVMGKHIIEFNSVEEYEKVREDLIHNVMGRSARATVFQVQIVTVAQHEKLLRDREDARIAKEKKQEAMRKAQEEVQEEVDEAEKQLEEAREKLGAVQLKSTSLNIG